MHSLVLEAQKALAKVSHAVLFPIPPKDDTVSTLVWSGSCTGQGLLEQVIVTAPEWDPLSTGRAGASSFEMVQPWWGGDNENHGSHKNIVLLIGFHTQKVVQPWLYQLYSRGY